MYCLSSIVVMAIFGDGYPNRVWVSHHLVIARSNVRCDVAIQRSDVECLNNKRADSARLSFI